MLPIKKAVIEVCGACNYKCQMCPHSFDGGRERPFRQMMNYQMYLGILDQLIDSEVEEIYLEGSGEPGMNKKLPDFIEAGVERGFRMCFITNGSLMKGQFMKDIIDAGLHFARVSVTGYNREKYIEWMSEDNFEEIIENCHGMINYIKETGSSAKIGSYSLIINNDEQDYEVEQYRKNFIDKVPGIQSSVWRMHNWSGVYDEITWRKKKSTRRSCGRPFSPDIIMSPLALPRTILNEMVDKRIAEMPLGPALTDVLTQLKNRPNIEEQWPEEHERGLRKGKRRMLTLESIRPNSICFRDIISSCPDTLAWWDSIDAG